MSIDYDIWLHLRAKKHAQDRQTTQRRAARHARRAGTGNYAAAELSYPTALDWPASEPPKYATARGVGLVEVPHVSKTAARATFGFTY